MNKQLFFSLSDSLVSNKDFYKYISILNNMFLFCKNNNIDLFIISEFKENYSNEILSKFNLNVSLKKNIISVSKDYIDSLKDLDKEIKEKEFNENYKFCDKYFKVFYFNNIFKENKKNLLFVCCDLLTEGYYSKKYSNIDFVILKQFISFNNKKIDVSKFKDNFIINNLEDIKKHLKKNTKFNYLNLFNFVNNYLTKNIVGNINVFSNKNISRFVLDRYKYNKNISCNDNNYNNKNYNDDSNCNNNYNENRDNDDSNSLKIKKK
jgi:hypothetical protein